MGESHFQLRKVCAAVILKLPVQGQSNTWQEDYLPCLHTRTVVKTPTTQAGWPCSTGDPEHCAEVGIRTVLCPCAGWHAAPRAQLWCSSCSFVLVSSSDLFGFAIQTNNQSHRLSICDFPTARPSNFVIFSSLCIKEKYACISSFRKNASPH